MILVNICGIIVVVMVIYEMKWGLRKLGEIHNEYKWMLYVCKKNVKNKKSYLRYVAFFYSVCRLVPVKVKMVTLSK